jgi:hypothetical protein
LIVFVHFHLFSDSSKYSLVISDGVNQIGAMLALQNKQAPAKMSLIRAKDYQAQQFSSGVGLLILQIDILTEALQS